MPKNIILCSDGTGQAGGTTPDSNVYKMYNAVDVHDPSNPQLSFYDNGVGSSSNKYVRGITGAMGLGFKRNVLDLYKYLARNYKPGDRVFLFGFSRGAATVRAFSGFLATCGLVDGQSLDKKKLEKAAGDAFKEYRRAKGDPSRGKKDGRRVIPVKFIGVWDTVSALGFPQGWNNPGLGMRIFNLLFWGLDHLSDFVFPHRFFNYELTDKVEFACQALAIDDERRTFRPMVWKETGDNVKNTTVEQIWFAGVHTNVGGGYGRDGLANVSLEWMMARARACGLKYKDGVEDENTEDVNVHGRLYDSRAGFAIYFRYQPRNIEELSKDKRTGQSILRAPIKIHRSVLERMERKTENYTPGQLPREFHVVDTSSDSKLQTVRVTDDGDDTAWQAIRKRIERPVYIRRWLYTLLLEFTLLVVVAGLWLWNFPPTGVAKEWALSGLMGQIADILNYFTPEMFEGLVTFAVLNQPIWFALAVLLLFGMFITRIISRRNLDEASEEAREMTVDAYARGNTGGSDGEDH